MHRQRSAKKQMNTLSMPLDQQSNSKTKSTHKPPTGGNIPTFINNSAQKSNQPGMRRHISRDNRVPQMDLNMTPSYQATGGQPSGASGSLVNTTLAESNDTSVVNN